MPAIPPIVHEVLRSPGQPLDPAMHAFMEPRFSADFSQVRIHTDTRAAESAHAVNALAYTVGHDVVFGANNYAPSSHNGRRLLAHELAHTIQQRDTSGAPPSADPHGIFESSADVAGREVAHGRGVSGDLPACGVGLSRAPASPDEIEMPGEYGFALDPRRRTWRRYAQSEGQKDAARIRKSGKLSSADRQEVNAKLGFFEGEAKEVYLREIKPTLLDVEAAERREREASRAYYTGTRQSVLDRMAAEQEERREREGRLAYYTGTRQAVLDRQAAKMREEVENTPSEQIQPQWKARKEAFISVASSPDHRLNRWQLFRIWLSYWAERNEAAQWSYGQIKYLPVEDRLEATETVKREEATASSMLRVGADISEFLHVVEDAGKHVTFQRINEVAIQKILYRNAWLGASAMTGARGGLSSPSSLAPVRLPTAPPVTSVRPSTAPPVTPVRPPTVPPVASAPVKPAPPAQPVAPAQPVMPTGLRGWLFGTRLKLAIEGAELSGGLPRNIGAGGPAVTAKAPTPSPAPTPASPSGGGVPTIVRPPASSGPTATKGAVRTPASVTPVPSAATGRARGTPAPAPKPAVKTPQALSAAIVGGRASIRVASGATPQPTPTPEATAAEATSGTAAQATAFTHGQLLDLYVRYFKRPGPPQGTIIFYPTQASFEAALQTADLPPGTPSFFTYPAEELAATSEVAATMGLIHLPPTVSTLDAMHEALHMIGAQSGVRDILGQYVEEGLTEWLARSLGPQARPNMYEQNVAFVERLARIVGEDTLRDAYLHRNWEPLRSALRARLGSELAVQHLYGLLRQVGPYGERGGVLVEVYDMLGPVSSGAPAPSSTTGGSVGAQQINQMIEEEIEGLPQPGSTPVSVGASPPPQPTPLPRAGPGGRAAQEPHLQIDEARPRLPNPPVPTKWEGMQDFGSHGIKWGTGPKGAQARLLELQGMSREKAIQEVEESGLTLSLAERWRYHYYFEYYEVNTQNLTAKFREELMAYVVELLSGKQVKTQGKIPPVPPRR
jgi:hypothetical protein